MHIYTFGGFTLTLYSKNPVPNYPIRVVVDQFKKGLEDYNKDMEAKKSWKKFQVDNLERQEIQKRR